MNKNICISKGCPFYHRACKNGFKNGIYTQEIKYECRKYNKEIKAVTQCDYK